MITILINRTAGKGIKQEKIDALISFFDKESVEYRIFCSDFKGHIKLLSSELAKSSTKILVVGGDGTIQEAIEGLISSNWPCPLAIIPAGTGNDFAKSLKIPLDFYEALSLALSLKEKKYYLGICNGKYFANVVSTGIDAAIVRNRLALKKILFGPLSYLISTIFTLMIYKPREYLIETDSSHYQGSFYLIAAGNGNFYGNGMNITPIGSPESDLLNLVIVRKTNRFRLLLLLPTIYTGKHVYSSYAESTLTSYIKITFLSGEQLVNYDGELEKTNMVIIGKSDLKIANIVTG